VVIAGPGHPLRESGLVPARSLSAFEWIALTDDQVGTGRVLGYFAAHGEAPPRIAVETSSPTHMFELMHHRPFLAQIPQSMLALAERFGVGKIDPEGTFWNSPAGICYRHAEHRSPALNLLIEAIRRGLDPERGG
jgi:DNA-binding transcriptional LysR family regulator